VFLKILMLVPLCPYLNDGVGMVADYDALRALDADNPPGVTAMSETDISRLPVRMYKGAGSSKTPETQMQPG
jgi:hypothetical protein